MNSFLGVLIKFDTFLARLEAGALIILVLAMSIVVFLQVIFRYVLTQSLPWTEEVARYAFLWICLLGAALTVQKRGHFGVELFYNMFSNNRRRFLQFITHLLMGVVVLVILVQGIVLVQSTVVSRSPSMGISMGWAYACIPVGATLMGIHLIVIIIKDGRR